MLSTPDGKVTLKVHSSGELKRCLIGSASCIRNSNLNENNAALSFAGFCKRNQSMVSLGMDTAPESRWAVHGADFATRRQNVAQLLVSSMHTST